MFGVKLKSFTKKVPIIFPNDLVHEFVATAIAPVLNETYGSKNVNVISAGDFCLLNGECSGESTTLKLKANPDDTDVIAGYDYFYGV